MASARQQLTRQQTRHRRFLSQTDAAYTPSNARIHTRSGSHDNAYFPEVRTNQAAAYSQINQHEHAQAAPRTQPSLPQDQQRLQYQSQAQVQQPQGIQSLAQGLSKDQLRQLYYQQIDDRIEAMFRAQSGTQAHQGQGPAQLDEQQHLVQLMERSRSHPQNYTFNENNLVAYEQRPASSDSKLHPQMAYRAPQRPHTPSTSLGNNPMTPQSHHHGHQQQQIYQHNLSDSGNIKTIKATSARVTRSQQSIPESQFETQFDDPQATIKPRRQAHTKNDSFTFPNVAPMPAESDALMSPPQTVAVMHGRQVDMAQMMSLNDMPKLDLQPTTDVSALNPVNQIIPGYADFDQFQTSPQSQTHESFHSNRTSIDFSAYGSPFRVASSPQNDVLDDLSLDATIEDTGISAEEVQSYIQEPTDDDIKWTCLYPECGKKFGRKENIRSHVQTHLGDRPYKCLHCNKCFVRQHDLKRHAKIHSGVKPYPCRCGNSFARHDALTRHRQRGICDGGFEGVVKKHVKRGRPRKHRPEDDERANKSAMTRERAKSRSNYASSVSGTSESSYFDSPSPHGQYEHNNDQYTNAEQLRQLTMLENDVSAFPAHHFSVTPPMSPYNAANAALPVKNGVSHHSSAHSALHVQTATEKEGRQEHNQLTATSDARLSQQEQQYGHNIELGSQPGSPPELSDSSPSSGHMMEFDLSNGGVTSVPSEGTGNDFDMFDMGNDSNDLFGDQWNESAFFNFDAKDGNSVVRMEGFGEDNIFSDSAHGAHMSGY